MASSPSGLRSFAAAIRHLATTRHEMIALARDQRALVQQVRDAEQTIDDLAQRTRHAEDLVAGLDASVERMHRTLVESDPRMALDIATAVRDDVRTLLVEVTEQANLLRDRATTTHGES
ncbi:MAG: hypothetical protein IT195_07540 [Microthrixaceae bacterium]|nr:hypothetical protein [Microthrixaceae bacterium]